MTKTKIKTNADVDLVSCKIPALMADAIVQFLKLDTAKQNKIFSRSEFVQRVLAQWFVMVENDFDIDVGFGLKDFDIPFFFPED